jgi:zinc and cadmium transporter
MSSAALLTYYCLLILAASIVGGMIPLWFQLTHRWMQVAVSFVAGVMLGVGVLHLLPHAVAGAIAATPSEPAVEAVTKTLLWLLAGLLAMFFIERFFCYHHHDVPADADAEHDGQGGEREHVHSEHVHDITWTGATLGLVLHSMLAGVALAAATQHGAGGMSLAGFGTFLVVFLHKPFDSMTIGMLMARGQWNLVWRHTVNGLFALAVPLGVVVFYLGLIPEEAGPAGARQLFVAHALAFSAGMFLCISLSDLLPELQFHRHDRIKLSAALLLGLGVALAALAVEGHEGHADHPGTIPPAANELSLGD